MRVSLNVHAGCARVMLDAMRSFIVHRAWICIAIARVFAACDRRDDGSVINK